MGKYETKFCSPLGGVGEQKVLYEKKIGAIRSIFFAVSPKQ